MPLPDDPDDEIGFVPPLHPDDRLWRHPSEMAAARRATNNPPPTDRVDVVGAPRLWTVAAASVLVGVAVTVAALSITGTFDKGGVRTVVQQVEVDTSADGSVPLTERIGPAIVKVDAVRSDGTVTATGVVFRSDGHLLTTADTVAGATAVTVTTNDGAVLAATVVGTDTSSDLAVLDVDREGMATAVLGRVANLRAGDDAVVVEREPGAASPGVAAGHVNAVGLRVDTTDGGTLHDMIQAALETTPATAGAVLCTDDGAVLGLVTGRRATRAAAYTPTSAALEGTTTTTATTATTTGMATLYATPIDYAAEVAAEIIETGSAHHTWLGVLGDDLDPTTASTLGRGGATLTRVEPAGPAEAAGLEQGDVVVALDGVQTTSMSSLVVALRSHRPGDVVSVTFVRDGAQRVATVTLTDRA
jgi:putative serine protease PepD